MCGLDVLDWSILAALAVASLLLIAFCLWHLIVQPRFERSQHQLNAAFSQRLREYQVQHRRAVASLQEQHEEDLQALNDKISRLQLATAQYRKLAKERKGRMNDLLGGSLDEKK